MEDCKKLEKLKADYKVFQEKYSLPNFNELNEDFQIEKIAEFETDFILREVRKYVTDKFFNYLRFIESLINPSNSPMFVFAIAKTLGVAEKEKLAEIYKKITKIEIDFIDLDLNYSEEKEADSIKNYSKLWKEVKKEISGIIEVMKKNLDNKTEDNGKGYFG
jgi:hypothetical protein